jgi:16S rRNA (cytosine967-C5)-methyltransferase
VRWRKDPALIERVAAEQAELLEAAAEQVRPGGVLVYSTCTISARENEEQMRAFLESHPGFRRERTVHLLPHRDGTDGFFIARLERSS